MTRIWCSISRQKNEGEWQTKNGRERELTRVLFEWIMAFIIKRARRKGNGMMAPHHPSFYFLPPTLFFRHSLAIHQTVSPLARSLPSPFTLFYLPHSSRDLLLSSERISLIHYMGGGGWATGRKRHRQSGGWICSGGLIRSGRGRWRGGG